MKIPSARWLSLLAVCLVPLAGKAQSYWVLSYQGTSTSGNGSGKLATEKVTEKTLIQNCATNSGASLTDLALVLHLNATVVGDAIEVINTNDPNLFRCEIMKLAFQQAYTNNHGGMKRFAYIYNEQSDHSRGSAVFTQQVSTQGGVTNITGINGTLQFWLGNWDESTNDPRAIVCTGTFSSKHALSLP
jgi:hypothetical protein